MKMKISKGDTVQIIAGSDKGMKGEVKAIDSKKLRVRVQGVRVQTHFDKKEGIIKGEGFVDYSNVKLVEKAKKDLKKLKSKSATKK